MRIITPENAAFGPVMLNTDYVLNFEDTITISGDVVGVYAPLWTATSANGLGGTYLVTKYAEVTATTHAATETFQFDTRWTYNATPDTDSLASLVINNIPNFVSDSQFLNFDNGTTLDWKYDVTGYVAGTSTVKVRLTLIRVA